MELNATHRNPADKAKMGGTGHSANENDNPHNATEQSPDVKHLSIRVTDSSNEVVFKLKSTTKLEKVIKAYCDRQGKNESTVRFFFDGQRIQKTDTPGELQMQDNDCIEMHEEQIGGGI
jgi:small ubiquitin-related modifier